MMRSGGGAVPGGAQSPAPRSPDLKAELNGHHIEHRAEHVVDQTTAGLEHGQAAREERDPLVEGTIHAELLSLRVDKSARRGVCAAAHGRSEAARRAKSKLAVAS